MRKSSLAVAAVTASITLAPVAAFAAWSGTGTGSGSAVATTVNRATAPTATRGAGTVALSWGATTLANGTAVRGYDVIRHVANSPDTIVCPYATTLTTSCTDQHPVAGSATYGVVARIGANWQGQESPTTPFIYDNVAPTTTMTTSPAAPDGTNGWFLHDVGVTLTATDLGSPAAGVRDIRYTVDGGATQVVAGAATSFTISAEKTTTVTYWAVDTLGNAEATHAATLSLDKTAPTSSISPASGATPLNPTITASDSTSGVASIRYSIDNGAATTVNASTATASVPAGAHTVNWTVTDAAGNASSGSASYAAVQPSLDSPVVTCGTLGKKLVSFSWAGVTGATSYDLYYPDGTTLSSNQTSTTFKFDGTANVVGDFSVKARNGSAVSAMSNVKHYDTGTGSTTGTCTPSTP